jgi:hypothetical protein
LRRGEKISGGVPASVDRFVANRYIVRLLAIASCVETCDHRLKGDPRQQDDIIPTVRCE